MSLTPSQGPSLFSPSTLLPQSQVTVGSANPHLLGGAFRGPFQNMHLVTLLLKSFGWLPTAWGTRPKRPRIQSFSAPTRTRLAGLPSHLPLPHFSVSSQAPVPGELLRTLQDPTRTSPPSLPREPLGGWEGRPWPLLWAGGLTWPVPRGRGRSLAPGWVAPHPQLRADAKVQARADRLTGRRTADKRGEEGREAGGFRSRRERAGEARSRR